MEQKYYGQVCQNDKIVADFRDLHKKLVNEVITFCKENGITNVNEFDLHADGLKLSINEGYWTPVTDSSFVIGNGRHEKTPYLFSM